MEVSKLNIKIRRLIAFLIDFVILFYVIYFPFYNLAKISDNIIFRIFLAIWLITISFNLFLRKDCIIGYESIGKKIMRLKIYQNGIRVQDKRLLIDRVFYSLWLSQFYLFMILINNKSRGDLKMNTEVK